MSNELKIVERKGNYVKTKSGGVYYVKFGVWGEDFGFIDNTDLPLEEFIKGMVN